MYQVSIFNNGIETIIHSPNPDRAAPHLTRLELAEKLSQVYYLTFSMPINNPGYMSLIELKTKIKVIDTRNNSVVFTGRILNITDAMNSDGTFFKEVLCENVFAYLADTIVGRISFVDKTPAHIISTLLNKHNTKVEQSRKIYDGIYEISQPITIDFNYETTLNAISKIRNILGGDISVIELPDGGLQFNYLMDQGSNNEVEIKLGHNMKGLITEYDPTSVITRVIALGYGEGINQLTIKSVNNGVEYLEDSNAVSYYGVIEGVHTDSDIQDAGTLKLKALTVLNENKQPKMSMSVNYVDLSYLGYAGSIVLGDTIHIINDVMNIDVYARMVSKDTDLLAQFYNPTVEISTRGIRLTDAILDLRQRQLSLEHSPQGSTCIFPLTKAENVDSTHPMEFDLDIPEEAININRVYINLHGRKYRAYEKGASSGGGSTKTSTSNGSYSATKTSTPANDYQSFSDFSTMDAQWDLGDPQDLDHHFHILNSTLRNFIYNHYHQTSISIAAHAHNVDVPAHEHGLIYDIYESTYPKNCDVYVNGTFASGSFGDGSNPFDVYSIDITALVHKGNNKIEIRTQQNGRIDATVYSQIFIQSK